MTVTIEGAYAVCRQIARREAKNFYYSFVALPKPKRDAMCAVYAFMRHADDLSDDETKPHAERRRELDAWMEAWRRTQGGEPADDPVFIALADTCRRFQIPRELLDQLVHGTAMDLEPEQPAGEECNRNSPYDTYATFDDLYRYCYYVASVVGLVCIRIFGYTDPRAEKLAEETGVAFQLTNILRDVREDAERGRIYLPLADLESFHFRPEELASFRGGASMTSSMRGLLGRTGERARQYYRSAQELLPLIAPDSRAALWVLVTIYEQLLRRIERKRYDVFSAKIRVPAWQKLVILLRGIVWLGVHRLTA